MTGEPNTGASGAASPGTRSGPGHIWIDGQLVSADGPHLSAFDRGFQLGDGVFETLRARAGRVTEFDAHLARLHRSADGLEIELPADVDDRIATGIDALLAAEGLTVSEADASVRITVSRGAYLTRGVLPVGERVPATVVVQVWPVVEAPGYDLERGLRLVTSRVRRDPQDPLASVKTTSRAEYVYARLEARRAGADDAVFLTIDGHLSESTSANLFLVRRSNVDGEPGEEGSDGDAELAGDGDLELATPSLDCAILPGTTRSWLLDWAGSVSLRPIETQLVPADLSDAREAFLSSSVAGILPVTSFDGQAIGDGLPGPWTRRARADREAMIRDTGPVSSP